jgi:8-oxo-dGTP pyrophosphatase MutT (NUDIX family)
MQVYVVVHDGTNVVIAQKAITSARWGGQSGREAAVNQAGQFALPGGRVEGRGPFTPADLVTNALREFREETGVGLTNAQNPSQSACSLLMQNRDYAVVAVRMSPAAMLEVVTAAANACIRRQITRDGELSSVFTMNRQLAYRYLGVFVQVDATAGQAALVRAAQSRRPYSQGPESITWYGEIAEYLRTHALS